MLNTKKLLFLVIALLILFYAGMTMYNKNKHMRTENTALADMVKQRFLAMNRHDTAAIAKFYSDGAVIQSPNMEKNETGTAGVRNVYGRYFLTSPDMKYTINRILTGDSSATVEYTFSGTMKHLESSVPDYMLNKFYSLNACEVLEIRNGKIVADATYFDQVAFLRQVGFFDHPSK